MAQARKGLAHLFSGSRDAGEQTPRQSSPASGPSDLFAGWPDRFEPLGQGQHGFTQAKSFSRPVVHLEVDVGVEITVPRRVEIFVPNTL